MSLRSRSTVKMLCVRSDSVMRKELPEEAQKLLELYEDPKVDPKMKETVKRKLDEEIRKLEDRVTTQRLRQPPDASSEPSVP